MRTTSVEASMCLTGCLQLLQPFQMWLSFLVIPELVDGCELFPAHATIAKRFLLLNCRQVEVRSPMGHEILVVVPLVRADATPKGAPVCRRGLVVGQELPYARFQSPCSSSSSSPFSCSCCCCCSSRRPILLLLARFRGSGCESDSFMGWITSCTALIAATCTCSARHTAPFLGHGPLAALCGW